MQGTTEHGYGVIFQGRKADVDKNLISASKVHSKDHVAVVDSNGGYIFPCNSTLARKINNSFRRRLSKNLVRYVCIGYTNIQHQGSTRSNQELCSMHAKQQSARLRHSRREQGRWQAWVRLTAALLQIMPIESEIVDEGIDDEAIVVQRHNVVVVGRGPTKLEVEHHVASGHAQHRTWCDACMRARGIAGRH